VNQIKNDLNRVETSLCFKQGWQSHRIVIENASHRTLFLLKNLIYISHRHLQKNHICYRISKLNKNNLRLFRFFNILATFFGDVMVMTSLKWRHNYIFEVRFCHNQLEKPQFGQITELQVINIEG